MDFLRNTWYAAGWSNEVSRTMLARTFLKEPVVLFRTEDGRPVALADRCPHRFVPLSRGKLKGDIVECAYHGLCFNTAGACTFNPHSDAIPKAARVRSYPVEERHGMIWIWMGDPQLADTGLLPDFSQFGNPERYAAVYGYLHVQANYQLITDNLLDLTHGQYIHPIFANVNGRPQEMLPTVPEERTVWAKYRRLCAYPNQYFQKLGFPKDSLADTHNEMRWNPPALLLLDVGITATGAPRQDGISVPTAHLLTPQTETSTHYFWGMARNFRMEDDALSKWLLEAGTNTFTTEDKPVIEAQQLAMGAETDLLKCDPVLLTTDGPSVRARRLLAEMIRTESQAAAVPSSRRVSVAN